MIKSSTRLDRRETNSVFGGVQVRVPIQRYIEGNGAKVHSYVVSVPFSPIDVDLGHLARGEWNVLTDRFRFWFMPGDGNTSGGQLCYVVIRKFDLQAGVLEYIHINANLGSGGERGEPKFMLVSSATTMSGRGRP